MKRILVTGASGKFGPSIQHIASEYSSLDFMFTDLQDLDIINSEILKSYFIIQTSWLSLELKKKFYSTILGNNLEDKVRLEEVGNYRTFAQRPKNSVLV